MSSLSIPVAALLLSSQVPAFNRTRVVQANVRISDFFCTDASVMG